MEICQPAGAFFILAHFGVQENLCPFFVSIVQSAPNGMVRSRTIIKILNRIYKEVIEGETSSEESKILVVFFSATGNTRPIAEYIADISDADIFEIIPVEPYSNDDLNYSDDNCRANREQADETVRPGIIGTFMESYDFSGKTIINFCTSGGSGIASVSSNLESMVKDVNWIEGIRFETNASKDVVRNWIDSLK